ncbi:MAG: hypothetical protein M3461_19380 [Pseudomonadota bacterium]|nr:hypothetical protein [Pseudomonadota bacterium]
MQQLMAREADIKRSDHLIIVDNSETLISSDRDIEILGKELKEIARRVGRVIITSRRREVIEAAPIAVTPLKSSEAVALLKERAAELGLKAIQRATAGDLRSLVADLECRPLVLEAFLQALTDPTTATLQLARNRVATMLRRDLGDFLFADAWGRYSAEMKRLLLLMTRVGDVHDARQLTICCEIAGVSVHSAEEALEESSGIASTVRINNGIEISFSSIFLKFAKERVVAVGGVNSPSSDEISEARRQSWSLHAGCAVVHWRQDSFCIPHPSCQGSVPGAKRWKK